MKTIIAISQALFITAFAIGLAVAFTGCGMSYDSGSSVSNQDESQEFGEGAQVNQPNTVVGANGDVDIDTSLDTGEAIAEAEDSEGCALLTADGPGGFVYKPISENDKNLVILLPEDVVFDFLCGIFTEESAQTENCAEQFSEDEEGRAVYRFEKPGASYISEFRAVKDGVSCTFVIPNTAERLDKEAA